MRCTPRPLVLTNLFLQGLLWQRRMDRLNQTKMLLEGEGRCFGAKCRPRNWVTSHQTQGSLGWHSLAPSVFYFSFKKHKILKIWELNLETVLKCKINVHTYHPFKQNGFLGRFCKRNIYFSFFTSQHFLSLIFKFYFGTFTFVNY